MRAVSSVKMSPIWEKTSLRMCTLRKARDLCHARNKGGAFALHVILVALFENKMENIYGETNTGKF